MRVFLRIVAAVAVVWAALVAGVLAAMHQPPARFSQIMSRVPEPLFLALPFKQLWLFSRAGRLKIGDAAPDFTLATLDRKSRVRLSSFRGARPVALIFGSYT